jgi:hypothetical protein
VSALPITGLLAGLLGTAGALALLHRRIGQPVAVTARVTLV